MSIRSTTVGIAVTSALAVATIAYLPASAAVRTPAATHAVTVPTYTHRDSGRTLHLHVGDRLRVRLRTVTDGDFFWHYVHRPDPKVVKVVRKRIIQPMLAPGEVGGVAHTIYRLKAVGHGRTRLRLVYYQGTNRQQVAKRFVLRFRVR